MAGLILLEGEPVLCEELADFFEASGHRVTTASTAAQFMRLFQPQEHMIAVINLGLPDGDGLELIRRVRRVGLRVGIVVLTARCSTQDKIDGLIGGADYYLSKPSDLKELSATISALERRLADREREQSRWLLQTSPRQLTPPGSSSIPLSTQDYLVLRTLALGGERVTREEIVRSLGADYFDYDQRRLDTQMRRLRRKVHESCGLELPVSTLRSVGYCFHAPIDVQY